MSRYDSDWDKYDLFNAMRDFLKKTNSVTVLIEIVRDAIEDYESD